jgi:hypothetical protein
MARSCGRARLHRCSSSTRLPIRMPRASLAES